MIGKKNHAEEQHIEPYDILSNLWSDRVLGLGKNSVFFDGLGLCLVKNWFSHYTLTRKWTRVSLQTEPTNVSIKNTLKLVLKVWFLRIRNII